MHSYSLKILKKCNPLSIKIMKLVTNNETTAWGQDHHGFLEWKPKYLTTWQAASLAFLIHGFEHCLCKKILSDATWSVISTAFSSLWTLENIKLLSLCRIIYNKHQTFKYIQSKPDFTAGLNIQRYYLTARHFYTMKYATKGIIMLYYKASNKLALKFI